jgi:GTP-binding protein
MHFIDKVKVDVIAGDGGNGKLSFRHEKFIDKGGPDGGDGGQGGDVVLVASRNENTLAVFRYQKEIKAKSGNPGEPNNRRGRSAPDLLVSVPVGTIAHGPEGEILADLVVDEQRAIIAKGGKGGFGNAHFVSSVRQAPRFAEKGEAGDTFQVELELKVIADVGLVGLPNAGKSTLLSRVSNARPEIADYPFTTLSPNLGVVDIDKSNSVLFADIPGLIEGASEGKGLGHEFLRHVERTAVLVHLIDAYNDDVAVAYKTIKDELAAYDAKLAARPEIIVLNKIDGLDDDIVADLLKQLKKVAPKGSELFAISAQSGKGLKELLYAVAAGVKTVREKVEVEAAETGIPVLRLADDALPWKVVKKGDSFIVTGMRIEKFAGRTEFDNEQAVRRLRDIMKRMGIMHELTRQGIEADQTITIGRAGSFEY